MARAIRVWNLVTDKFAQGILGESQIRFFKSHKNDTSFILTHVSMTFKNRGPAISREVLSAMGLTVQEVDENPAQQLWLKPRRFGRHDLTGIRDIHQVF
jgi:hypothetical protein